MCDLKMPRKRKNRGRAEGRGKKGRSELVKCSNCGRRISVDKAIKRVVWVSAVSKDLARELQKEGAVVPKKREVRYYCVSCAVHFGIAKIRAREERKELPEEILRRRFRV